MRAHLEWVVVMADGTEVATTIPDIEYQSEDHIGEEVAQSVAPAFNPDDVEDWWER